jgi:DNA-binding MarR family transcriptional regulator
MLRDYLPYRTLLQIAARRKGGEAGSCRMVLEVLGAAAAVRTALRREFADVRLGELDFEMLVSLFATDSAGMTPAMLAVQTGATRSAITEAIDRLETRALVRRERSTRDRRSVVVSLTPAGASMSQECISRFIAIASRLALPAPRPSADALADICADLCRAAAVKHPSGHDYGPLRQ